MRPKGIDNYSSLPAYLSIHLSINLSVYRSIYGSIYWLDSPGSLSCPASRKSRGRRCLQTKKSQRGPCDYLASALALRGCCILSLVSVSTLYGCMPHIARKRMCVHIYPHVIGRYLYTWESDCVYICINTYMYKFRCKYGTGTCWQKALVPKAASEGKV